MYYCDLYTILDDVMYAELNYNQPIPTSVSETILNKPNNYKMLLKMYDKHCRKCPCRLNCSLFDAIHCDDEFESFDSKVEICHNHFKTLYAEEWEDYVNDFR